MKSGRQNAMGARMSKAQRMARAEKAAAKAKQGGPPSLGKTRFTVPQRRAACKPTACSRLLRPRPHVERGQFSRMHRLKPPVCRLHRLDQLPVGSVGYVH